MLTFQLVHLRGLREALADVMDVDLSSIDLPAGEPDPQNNYFDIVLRDLRVVVVPHIADKAAAHRAKGMARLIKYWQKKAQLGPTFDAAGLGDLRALGG